MEGWQQEALPQSSRSQSASIDSITDDCLATILSWLPVSTALRVGAVHTRWHEALSSSVSWRNLPMELLTLAGHNQCLRVPEHGPSDIVPTCPSSSKTYRVSTAQIVAACFGKSLLSNANFLERLNNAWAVSIRRPAPATWDFPDNLPCEEERASALPNAELTGGGHSDAWDSTTGCVAFQTSWGEMVQVVDLLDVLTRRGLDAQVAQQVLDLCLPLDLSVWATSGPAGCGEVQLLTLGLTPARYDALVGIRSDGKPAAADAQAAALLSLSLPPPGTVNWQAGGADPDMGPRQGTDTPVLQHLRSTGAVLTVLGPTKTPKPGTWKKLCIRTRPDQAVGQAIRYIMVVLRGRALQGDGTLPAASPIRVGLLPAPAKGPRVCCAELTWAPRT